MLEGQRPKKMFELATKFSIVTFSSRATRLVKIYSHGTNNDILIFQLSVDLLATSGH